MGCGLLVAERAVENFAQERAQRLVGGIPGIAPEEPGRRDDDGTGTLAPYTWTESRRMLEPLGIDRWPYELALKYGMRDGLMCPVR